MDFRTEIQYELSRTQDQDVLYRTYFTLTRPKIESACLELFESRGLDPWTEDFNTFLNDILPSSGLSASDNAQMLRNMADGKLLDQNYLSASDDRVVNLRDVSDPILNDDLLSRLFNHRASSFSASSVGKGEFGFVLLTNGSTKSKVGGDLRMGDTEVEIKARGAKMASQNTHLSLSSVKAQVQEYLGIKDCPPPLNKKHLNGFYQERLGWAGTRDLLKMVFSSVMHAETESFDWIDSCIDPDDFFEKLAIKEFTYYKKVGKFDKLLFLNPNNLNIYSTTEMDEQKIENFTFTQGFAFYNERIQTNYWHLK